MLLHLLDNPGTVQWLCLRDEAQLTKDCWEVEKRTPLKKLDRDNLSKPEVQLVLLDRTSDRSADSASRPETLDVVYQRLQTRSACVGASPSTEEDSHRRGESGLFKGALACIRWPDTAQGSEGNTAHHQLLDMTEL